MTIAVAFLIFCNIGTLSDQHKTQVNNIVSFLRMKTPDPALGITTVMTTCCRKNVPDVSIIKKHFESLEMAPMLKDRIVLAFDGAIQIDNTLHKKCKDSCDSVKYKEYIDHVVALANMHFRHVEYIVSPHRVCLKSSLKNAFSLVKTDFVYICQEDLILKTPVNVQLLLEIIAEYSIVDVIRLSTETNQYHIDYTEHSCKKRPSVEQINVNGVLLTKSSQYSDQNQITHREYYERVIFPNTVDGDFMEHQIECASFTQPELYGTMWYLGDFHDGQSDWLDGRNQIPVASRGHGDKLEY